MALTAALAAVVVSATADAQDASKPAPCIDYLTTDKTGDQSFDASGLGLGGSPAQDNADITGLFFNFKDGKLTANLEISKLDKTVPSSAEAQGGIWYYVFWSYKGTIHFVRAANTDGSEISYATGHLDDSSQAFIFYVTDGEIQGSFHEGDKGVIAMEVPADKGGVLGETLGQAGATADYIQGPNDSEGINNRVDTAPGDYSPGDGGRNYKVEECPAPGTTPTPTVSPTVTATATPPGGSEALPFRAANVIGKARKAKKGKQLAFKARATEPITNLRMKLKNAKGKGPVLAKGKAPQVQEGIVKVKIKLKKTLKKGRYTLISVGVVDGETRTARQPVLLKK